MSLKHILIGMLLNQVIEQQNKSRKSSKRKTK